MIRTSKRRNAGSRRNKRFKDARDADKACSQSSLSGRDDTMGHWRGHTNACLELPRWRKCNCNPHEHMSKPNHADRAVSLDTLANTKIRTRSKTTLELLERHELTESTNG